jgi:hypothetical protein
MAGAGTCSPALTTLLARLQAGELYSELAAELAGGPVTCGQLRQDAADVLTAREHWALQTYRGRQCLAVRRSSVLRGESGMAVARVSAVFLPGRVADECARRELADGDVPLGTALAPLGVVRRSLRAWVTGRGEVRSSGLLLLPDGAGLLPVALAEEELLPIL